MNCEKAHLQRLVPGWQHPDDLAKKAQQTQSKSSVFIETESQSLVHSQHLADPHLALVSVKKERILRGKILKITSFF